MKEWPKHYTDYRPHFTDYVCPLNSYYTVDFYFLLFMVCRPSGYTLKVLQCISISTQI